MAVGQAGLRTVLIDGSLQFGDLRALLKVPMEAPSLLDLPTDRIQESDLADVLWRDPSGIDILLAPPRVEMAEMVTVRDLEKTLSLLRRVYEVVIVDTPAVVNDINLALPRHLGHDPRGRHLRLDDDPLHDGHGRRVPDDRLPADQGALPRQPRRLDRRLRPRGARRGARAASRSTASRSGGALVVRANNEGIPFVLADPSAQISQDVTRTAAELLGRRAPAAAGRR